MQFGMTPFGIGFAAGVGMACALFGVGYIAIKALILIADALADKERAS